jgi:hypothetical protein
MRLLTLTKKSLQSDVLNLYTDITWTLVSDNTAYSVRLRVMLLVQ